VGFEPMISVFERTKTVHALDHAATVIGTAYFTFLNLWIAKVKVKLSCAELVKYYAM
jgi:hypothetical protein